MSRLSHTKKPEEIYTNCDFALTYHFKICYVLDVTCTMALSGFYELIERECIVCCWSFFSAIVRMVIGFAYFITITVRTRIML